MDLPNNEVKTYQVSRARRQASRPCKSDKQVIEMNAPTDARKRCYKSNGEIQPLFIMSTADAPWMISQLSLRRNCL